MKFIKKLLCKLGFHDDVYKGLSIYRYHTGSSICEEKGDVHQCKQCKRIDAPWWWEKENRDLHPATYLDGSSCNWKEDVKVEK